MPIYASLIQDALAALGCAALTLLLVAGLFVLLALRLPAVVSFLKPYLKGGGDGG